jgi:hypothetical protein
LGALDAGRVEDVPVVEPLVLPRWTPPTMRRVAREFELHSAARVALAMDDAELPFDCDVVAARLGISRATVGRALAWLVDDKRKVIERLDAPAGEGEAQPQRRLPVQALPVGRDRFLEAGVPPQCGTRQGSPFGCEYGLGRISAARSLAARRAPR